MIQMYIRKFGAGRYEDLFNREANKYGANAVEFLTKTLKSELDKWLLCVLEIQRYSKVTYTWGTRCSKVTHTWGTKYLSINKHEFLTYTKSLEVLAKY